MVIGFFVAVFVGLLLLVSVGQVLVRRRRRFGASKAVPSDSTPTKGDAKSSMLGLLAGVLIAALAFLLLRFGFHWIVVGVSALVGLRRWVFPLFRLLPIVRSLAQWANGKRAVHGQSEPRGRQPASRMTKSEALEVLGLQEGASSEQVALAYKNLMVKVHPDHGGSTFLASQVNEARRVLT